MKIFATCLCLWVLLLLRVPGVCEAGTTLTIKAGQAQVKTVGALEGSVWNVWSNGDWGDFISFAKPGTYKVRVQCYGSPCDGVWPEMAFRVDGVIREMVTVPSNKTAEYTFKFEAQAKDYQVAVSFLNDAQTKTEDRNLYIASMSIEVPDDAPAPTVTTEKAWRARWTQEQIKSEADLLAKAAEAIERNRKRDAAVRVVGEEGHAVAGTALVVELTRHDFLFGCNIYMFDRFRTPRENELYKQRFRDLFNYATTGFYWRWYEAKRGKPDYAYTDKVVAWCIQNHIRVKGHPLLWATESGIPPWSKGQPPAEVRKQRVTDIMTRYAGKIDYWEVVNEPANALGVEIDDPYRWARQVSPKACLIVNDFNVMATGCPAFFKLLEKAISKGVPFDGIGIQAHEPRTMRFPLEQAWKTLDQYAALGKPLYITEFTPTSRGQEITGSHIVGKWDEAAQADCAVKFYTVCFAHPAMAGITWWDLSDEGAWLEGGGLLHKDLSPKAAYTALMKLIHDQWATRKEGKTDGDGKFTFRGFCGEYVARITRDGKLMEQAFHVGAQDHDEIKIVLRMTPSNQPDNGNGR